MATDTDYIFLRPMMKYIQQHLKEPLTLVELGVDRGIHAHSILSNLQIKKSFLVDPYLAYKEYSDGSFNADVDQETAEKNYLFAQKVLYNFKDKIEWVREFSEKAVNLVPDGVDGVYCDANHTYESTKKDIELWYPKVRKGGVFGGHNFDNRFPEVGKAVLEFIEEYKLKLWISPPSKEITVHGNDWWWIKK